MLTKALSKIPEDRYGSCLEFVAALRVATGGGTGRKADPPARENSRTPGAPGDSAPPKEPPVWARPVFYGLPGGP